MAILSFIWQKIGKICTSCKLFHRLLSKSAQSAPKKFEYGVLKFLSPIKIEGQNIFGLKRLFKKKRAQRILVLKNMVQKIKVNKI